MTRITRMLATRLRRIARPTRPASTSRTAAADAWSRLERSLRTTGLGLGATRRREWVHEGARLSITLIGQQGRAALARILAGCDGEVQDAGTSTRVVLSVASTLGHTP